MTVSRKAEPGMRKIFLVRHGLSEWNGQKRISGQLDPPLSPMGVRQAQCLKSLLRDEQLSAVYASPLSRAVETAAPTAALHRLAVKTCEALKEIHLGILQGRFRDERDAEAQRLWAEREKEKLHYRVPGGETFLELETRVVPCLQDILRQEGTVLIVGHRSTNRVILRKLMRWPLNVASELDLRSKYLYEIVPGESPRINTIRLDDGHKYEGFRM